ncbi:helix-turn-helix transcriptional regulator [Streptomyces sp. NBC_00623]|uniref:helix-turn-helix domain-containing protein n=2 Tax=Streptomyces TaxID=1883 RepID=UPI0030E1CEEB
MDKLELRGRTTVLEGQDGGSGRGRFSVADISRMAAGLTARETEVFRQLRDGPSTRDLAMRLGITERTVKHHVVNIRTKFGDISRFQLCLLSATWGTAPTDD